MRGVEHGTELLGVLAREHRGGRHDGGLGPGVGDGGERDRGDGGLAGPDVAQEQPVHDARGGHVGQDLVGGDTLLVGEVEGKRGEKGVHVRSPADVRAGLHAGELDLASGEKGQLEAEQLVVGEPPAREARGRHGRREVDVAQGTSERHEAAAGGERRRQPVADVGGVGDGRGDDPAHPACGEALGDGMDGQDARVAAGAALPRHDLVERGLHLPEAVAKGHLARERDGVPLVHLLGDPRLAEERGDEDARLVHDGELDNLHVGPGARAALVDPVDRGDDRGVAPHVGTGDLGDVREVEVAVGHVQQEVADAPDPQARERLLARALHVAQARHRVREGAGSLHPLCC